MRRICDWERCGCAGKREEETSFCHKVYEKTRSMTVSLRGYPRVYTKSSILCFLPVQLLTQMCRGATNDKSKRNDWFLPSFRAVNERKKKQFWRKLSSLNLCCSARGYFEESTVVRSVRYCITPIKLGLSNFEEINQFAGRSYDMMSNIFTNEEMTIVAKAPFVIETERNSVWGNGPIELYKAVLHPIDTSMKAVVDI